MRSTFEESRQTLGLSRITHNNSTVQPAPAKPDHIYKKKYSEIDFSLLTFVPKVKSEEELVEVYQQKKLIRHQKAFDVIQKKMQYSLKTVKRAKENSNMITQTLLDMTVSPAPSTGVKASIVPISFSDVLHQSPNIKSDTETETITLNLIEAKNNEEVMKHGLCIINEEISKDSQSLTNAHYF